MARIRTIKPEFFSHYDLYEAEQETGLPLRLAFAGLWTQCDRDGRFKWRPQQLKIGCLPYDDVDFSRVLHALGTRGFIGKYVQNKDTYGVVFSFKEHQVINNREKESVLPEPVDFIGFDVCVTREPREDHACTGEGKGKEGKGKEGKGTSNKTLVYDSCQSKIAKRIFEHWRTRMGKTNSSKLTDDRRKKIYARLRDGYSEKSMIEAIDGCAQSDFHMGRDPKTNGKVYDELTLILRNGTHLEKFQHLGSLTASRQADLDAWINNDQPPSDYIDGEYTNHDQPRQSDFCANAPQTHGPDGAARAIGDRD